MKRILTTLFFITLMVTLLIPSTQATGIIELGTMPYKGSTTIGINQTYDVDLVNIFTSLQNSLTYRKFGFNPLTNQTTYLFVSQTMNIDHTFINDTKPYLFQDTVGQIYRIYIDFRNATVPLNPLILSYVTLGMRLNSTLENITRLNSSLLGMNTSFANLTLEYNSTYFQLQRMSLNFSLAQTTVHDLNRDNEGLENELFITRILIPFIVVFFSIIAVLAGKRFGWLNKGQEGRLRKRLETGYGKAVKWNDNRIRNKNDEITRKRGDYSYINGNGRIQREPPMNREQRTQEYNEQPLSYTKEKINAPKRDEVSRFVDELPSRNVQPIISPVIKPREIPYTEQGEEKEWETKQSPTQPIQETMLSQGETIKKLCKEGVKAEKIIELTGYDKQYVNAICKKHAPV